MSTIDTIRAKEKQRYLDEFEKAPRWRWLRAGHRAPVYVTRWPKGLKLVVQCGFIEWDVTENLIDTRPKPRPAVSMNDLEAP